MCMELASIEAESRGQRGGCPCSPKNRGYSDFGADREREAVEGGPRTQCVRGGWWRANGKHRRDYHDRPIPVAKREALAKTDARRRERRLLAV